MTTAFSPTPFGHRSQAVSGIVFTDNAPVRPRRLPAEVYRRRRVAAAVLVVTFLVLVAWTVVSLAGGYFTGVADAAPTSAGEGARVAIVQPGDTLWTIAGDIDTDVDLRTTVDQLVELNGSSALTVGQRLVLPAS